MKRIIVAEDENQTRRSIAMVLESTGFVVQQAKNGLEAMEMLVNTERSKPVDLLLTDIFMPVMTGLELIDFIQRQELPLPVMVITGYRDEKLTAQLSKLNCHYFIDKPFEPDVLLNCMDRIFKQNQVHQPLNGADKRIAV